MERGLIRPKAKAKGSLNEKPHAEKAAPKSAPKAKGRPKAKARSESALNNSL